MEVIKKYPELKKQFEKMYRIRCDEILSEMLENDDKYKRLSRERRDASNELKKAVINSEADELFEKYSDTVYEREAYVLDTVYKRAIEDAISVLQSQGLL